MRVIAWVLTFGWAGTKRGKYQLRRVAGGLASTALFLRSRRLPKGDLSRVVVIAPHPDDETFGCGGSVALVSRTDASVHVIFVTDGRASHPGHATKSPEAIASIRLDEARLATAALGVRWENTRVMNEPDGGLGRLPSAKRQEVAGRIARHLRELSPGAVLLPCRKDGSSEHEAAFALVRDALGMAGLEARVLEFPVWSRWNPLLLVSPILGSRRVWRVDITSAKEAKARAIACYSSQTKPIPPDVDPALPEGFALMFLGRYEFLIEN